MNENYILMKNELRFISTYRALILSKYYLTFVLGLTSFYLGSMRMTVSSFYILLELNALPPILAFALKDYSNKYNFKLLNNITQEAPFQLHRLKTKYKYSRLSYITNSIAYLIMIILICLWQINYSYTIASNTLLNKLPFLTLITGLFLRFSAVIFYRIKLHYDLSNNKV